MVSRTARPRTVLLADGAPGPSAHMPEFRLAARPFGPLTSTRGAWGPVDMALLRMYIFGSARQRTAAIRGGRGSGPRPAMTARIAGLSAMGLRSNSSCRQITPKWGTWYGPAVATR